jgi:RNA polymerase sigma-70 factor (ECF subfamily)
MDSPVDSRLQGLAVSFHRDIASEPASLQDDVLALFTQYRGPLLRYMRSLGLPIQDGEEVVQEVFLALFRHLQAGKPRTNLRAWIFTTGHHLALRQRLRNERRWRVHCREDVAGNEIDPTPSPEDHLEHKERQRHLMAVVHALPENDRCCLYLRAEGLRYRDIAKALGISLGGVSLSLARSLARLAHADKR